MTEISMEKERCDNCLYEYACDWNKAGDELRCEDWKPEDERICPVWFQHHAGAGSGAHIYVERSGIQPVCDDL